MMLDVDVDVTRGMWMLGGGVLAAVGMEADAAVDMEADTGDLDAGRGR